MVRRPAWSPISLECGYGVRGGQIEVRVRRLGERGAVGLTRVEGLKEGIIVDESGDAQERRGEEKGARGPG